VYKRFERRVDRTYPLMNDTGLHVWLDCGHRGIYQGPLKDLPKVVYCDKCRREAMQPMVRVPGQKRASVG
jgi:hypothetical protein